MMAVQFISGASLFALLIVDVWCIPLKGGDPGSYYGGYANAADFNQGAPHSHFSPGVAVSNQGVSTSYQPAVEGPSFSQPAVHGQPATSGGSFSGPVSGHRGSSVRVNPASSMHPGAAPQHPGTASQPGPREIAWAVEPPSLGGEESTGPHAHVASSGPEYVSPPLPPPGPMYQAGELSQYEQNFEYGDYLSETEDEGHLPPPMPVSSEQDYASSSVQGYTSSPQPQSGSWLPYPYYDYMFLTGQYPPGTLTHSSSSYEQGHDGWQDAHYVRYYYGPYNQVPEQTTETFSADLAAPPSVKAPRQPVRSAVKQ